MPPSLHARTLSLPTPPRRRYDLRQFLYNSKWTWQFRQIDRDAAHLARDRAAAPSAAKL